MKRQNNTHKSNPFLLSNQVKNILQKKGFSSIFNFTDYECFKEQCKDAFNKAVAIADLFISESKPENNDLDNYVF